MVGEQKSRLPYWTVMTGMSLEVLDEYRQVSPGKEIYEMGCDEDVEQR
jgi:hypothetical protein